MEYSTDRKLRSRRREGDSSRSRFVAEEDGSGKQVEDEPLIHPNVVDPASQRIFLVSFFVLIQCWKLYDVVMLKTGVERTVAGGLLPLNSFTFVLKYAIAEGLFLWILPILNVQYLTFSPFKTLLLTFLLNGYTFVLASDTTIPILSGIVLPIWNSINKKKELTIGGDTVTPQSVIDMSTHFKGKYTIKYLPDLSAKFNPFKFENLCLTSSPSISSYSSSSSSSSSNIFNMPIEFNTTNQLGSLEIQHTDPFNKVSYINFTSYELSKLARKDYTHLSSFVSKEAKLDHRVFYIEVPLSASGSYKIHSVKDSKGISIRTYKSLVLLLSCPTAKFVYPKESNLYGKPICVPPSKEEVDSRLTNLNLPIVKAYGVTPLTLKIDTIVNGKKKNGFSFVVNDNEEEKLKIKKSSTDLSWLQSHSISRNIIEQEILQNPSAIIPANEGGSLEFHLSEIVDSLGHLIRYNPSSKDLEIFHSLDLRMEPTILILEAQPDQPLLINRTKTLLIVPRSNSFQNSDFPLSVNIAYEHPSKDSLLAYNFTKVFVDSLDLKKGFNVDKEGLYTVFEGKSKFCDCNIDRSKNKVSITLAPLPVVDIKAEPIVDKCVGMTGYNFEFEFIGAPPFQIQYQVFQKHSNGAVRLLQNENGMASRYIKSYNSKHDFMYKPPREGTYLVVFNKLKDMNYQKDPVQLDEATHTYETYFKQRSSASLSLGGRRSLNGCLNQATTIPLKLRGNPPFSFAYSVIERESKKKLIDRKIVENVDSDVFEIQTPAFEFGGEFQVIISNLKDGLSCDVDFDYKKEIFTIKTRKDIPKVSFPEKFKNKEIKLVEGDSMKIALNLISSTGRTSNDKLVFSVTSLDNPEDVKKFSLRDLDSFHIREEGIYSLVSFSNGDCSGEVPAEKETIKVSFYSRPSLEIQGLNENVLNKIDSSTHLKAACQNCRNEVMLNLKGVAPFVVDYEVTLPSGKIESRTMTIEENSLKILLPTNQSGKYKHSFKSIFDQLYTREKVHKSSASKSGVLASVRYDIHPSPDALFNKEKFIQICESNVNQVGVITEIPIKFVGSYPFKANVSLTHELTGDVDHLILEGITEPVLRISELHETLSVGNHILTFNEIVDSNGCSRTEFSELNNFVIAITEVPNISKRKHLNTTSKKEYYCVGDHISYNMSGFPPFTVYYEFNGHQQKAELSPPIFQRLASKAGNLSITALLDSSANQCLVNFTSDISKLEELKLRIYDLPSVEINQGDYIVEDIHEGDQTEIVFSFEGVPPFTLTYIRTIEVKGKGNTVYDKVMEKKTIKDIWDYTYTVRASLEGTYEAIELSDAYCVARRDERDY